MVYFSCFVTSLVSSPSSDFIWLPKALSNLSYSYQAKDVGNKSHSVKRQVVARDTISKIKLSRLSYVTRSGLCVSSSFLMGSARTELKKTSKIPS